MAYKIGSVVEGKVTGIQPYGAFVSLDENTQGLIHISEIRYGYIKNIKEAISIGDTVTVKVIDVDEFSHKISLSMRALKSDPVEPITKRKKFYTNPKHKLGFKTLENVMQKWIDESLSNLKK